ncbi:MAG: response regulator [Ignavibacterium album]|uniref:hybrid sensor histidine kinase/response regulator n=1 Tax=Ignavibacterium album TaxID=591197 RepID=UPI0026ED41BF|nr:response regulator [Ignavibacterium album]MCX8104652.1 response regulator [Ignavibacterium album]
MKYKILVIEDEPKLRENICEILENEGYTVEFAENGTIGLVKVKKFNPDLIISDIMMPEMNGFDLLEKLQENSETASIPFIFLTAKVEPENLRKGMSLGADDYLFKPFHIHDLINAVKKRILKKEMNDKKIKEMQEQIIAKVPHELRTPLVPILGYSELIEEETDLENIKEMARVIKMHGKFLHGKIEKFLLYTDLLLKRKIKSKNDKKISTPINNDLVGYLLIEYPSDLKAKERIQYNLENAFLEIEEEELKTILNELIENSLKFSDPNTQITVEGKTNGSDYFLEIRDYGRGMTQEEINSITAFKKFGKEQLTETGLGLGLALVNLIVELRQGSITITSEKNKFTKVFLSLHLAS